MARSNALWAALIAVVAPGTQLANAVPAVVAAAAPQVGVVDRAVALRQAGQFTEAAQTLIEWLADHPEDARAHNELGALYAMHGQLRDALDQFSLAVRSDATLRVARWNLAETLRADERCGEALPHYKRLADDDGKDGLPRKGMALCHAILGQWTEAIVDCDGIVRQFPGTSLGTWASAHRDRIRELASGGALSVGQMDTEGKQLFAEKRYADAAVWLASALQAEATADRAYRLAMAYLGAQDLMAAQAALERAVRLDPNHQPARMAQATMARALRSLGSGAANIAFAKLDETAERALARALLDNDMVVARQLAQPIANAKADLAQGAVSLLLAGEVSLRDNAPAKAAELFERALKARPNHDAARKALADAAISLGKFVEGRRLAALPPPPPYVAENADLQAFVRQRRIEFAHHLQMMVDPGVRPAAALVDLVAGDLPLPPPPPPPVPEPTVPKGKPGQKGPTKPGKGK